MRNNLSNEMYQNAIEKHPEMCIGAYYNQAMNSIINKYHDYQLLVYENLTTLNNICIQYSFQYNECIKMFQEISESINNSNPFENGEMEFNLEKCFQFPLCLDSKTPIIVQKKFEDAKEVTNNINDSSGTEQVKKDKSDVKLIYSYKKLSYLIDNINRENNFKVKLIYLDLYLNVLTPKCEIKKMFEDLNQNLKDTRERLLKLEQEQKNTEHLMDVIDILVKHIKKSDPTFDETKLNIK